jgi:hypothetical protein
LRALPSRVADHVLFLVRAQKFVSALAVICDVLKEMEMLLLAVGSDCQTIEQHALPEVNVLDGVSIDSVFALTKPASRYEDQSLVVDL